MNDTLSLIQPLSRKHLLDIESLSTEEIQQLLNNTRYFKEFIMESNAKASLLQGITVATLFFENSTRTKTSFEIAARRLGADVVSLAVSSSSITKGETIIDTAKTFIAMGVDIIVMRHHASGAPHLLAQHIDIGVANAGDGTHEHPTQGLLDAFTILEEKGRIEGLKIAIVGDILHSRVARSNIHLLTRLGAKVTLIGPTTLVPQLFSELGVKVEHDLMKGIEGADVINILRIQHERMTMNFFPSIREYTLLYGITSKRIQQVCPHTMIMHPGPINRGIEIDQDVADGAKSFIERQVCNGVATRMAVLSMLAKARNFD